MSTVDQLIRQGLQDKYMSNEEKLGAVSTALESVMPDAKYPYINGVVTAIVA